jgi:hypothetical protein
MGYRETDWSVYLSNGKDALDWDGAGMLLLDAVRHVAARFDPR